LLYSFLQNRDITFSESGRKKTTERYNEPHGNHYFEQKANNFTQKAISPSEIHGLGGFARGVLGASGIKASVVIAYSSVTLKWKVSTAKILAPHSFSQAASLPSIWKSSHEFKIVNNCSVSPLGGITVLYPSITAA
jgi:hypothetical protein